MKYPDSPRKPKEPIKPKEYYFNFQSLDVPTDKILTYQDLVKLLPKGKTEKDLIFKSTEKEVGGYDRCDYVVILEVGYDKPLKNTGYKSQYKIYLKDIEEYPIKLSQYEKDVLEYDQKLEAWKLSEAKKELKDAQKVLDRLTQAQKEVRAAENKIKKLSKKNAKTN